MTKTPVQLERLRRNQANYRKSAPDAIYSTILKIKYGITLADYLFMESAQHKRCAVCGTDKPGSNRKRWCVDHDHKSGVIRGLLCLKCNSGLGALGDNAVGVQRALDYLEPPTTLVDEHY